MITRLVTAITPYLIWVALATGIAAGGAVVGYIQGIRVDRARVAAERLAVQRDGLIQNVADRDRAIAEAQRSARLLYDSIGRQNAAIESLAADADRRAQEAARLRETVARANAPIVRSIAALTAQMQAPAAAMQTCADAFEQWRAERRK